MKNPKIILTFLIAVCFLNGCSADLSDYKEVDSPFDIKKYFTGDLVAWGMLQDYTEKVNRRFCVEINGNWTGNKGVLAEKFYFDDGEISYRNWQLTKNTDGSYEGQAEDVMGVANGKHQGFAFQFTYNLLIEVDNSTYEVVMDDWMYQIDKYRVMNKTSISKLGVTIANVSLFFDKESNVKTCASSIPMTFSAARS
jgi:hypothetical protein